jgi:hypothetical protein
VKAFTYLPMTLLVTHLSRTAAPRIFAMPVVRELPAAPAAAGVSSAW